MLFESEVYWQYIHIIQIYTEQV